MKTAPLSKNSASIAASPQKLFYQHVTWGWVKVICQSTVNFFTSYGLFFWKQKYYRKGKIQSGLLWFKMNGQNTGWTTNHCDGPCFLPDLSAYKLQQYRRRSWHNANQLWKSYHQRNESVGLWKHWCKNRWLWTWMEASFSSVEKWHTVPGLPIVVRSMVNCK